MAVCRAAGLVGWIFVSALSAACADERATSIARLFEVGWSISPQARQAADSQYATIQSLGPADSLSSKAWWLVLMQQRRFEEALQQVQRHLEREPEDLAALRAKTWLLTILKNYPAALVAADQLSLQVASRPPEDEPQRVLQEESIGFLGRLFGYLSGPVADIVNQDERRRFEKRIFERLPESQRPRFEDARNAVLDRYFVMTDESDAAGERTKELAAAEKAKTLAELQSEREKLDERNKEIEDRQKKIQNELRAELSDLDRQEMPLLQQQTQLAGRVEMLNADLLGYTSQILTLEQLASREQDAVLRQQYLNQANSLSLLLGRIEADLFNTNRLLRNVQSQRTTLFNRRLQAQAGTNSQIDKLSREAAELDRRERRNVGLERRASRTTSNVSGKQRSLSAQAAALSTYDVYPLEAEKARLLESLK